MEPITFTAILAALSVISEGAGGAVGQKLATDAYEKLKATLRRRFSDDSDVVEAVDLLEQKPDSKGRKQTLQEEVVASGADQDREVREAAQELLDQVKAQPGGEQHIQNAIGSYISQADRGSTATVSVNQPKDSFNQRKG
jgi:Arc/MetJ-type ribon-helix-helix transcriptional regulator